MTHDQASVFSHILESGIRHLSEVARTGAGLAETQEQAEIFRTVMKDLEALRQMPGFAALHRAALGISEAFSSK